jgi:ferritin-like metal-binding protein YciE
MMATSLQDLFVEELRDMYDAEKRLLRALPKMARAAESPQLKTAFTTHARETERQVARLEQVFRALGQPVRGKKCDGIMGIIEEGNTAMEELDGPLLDAALIAGAQKAEHYEIASYGTLAYFAELLNQDRAKTLLGETLDEEKATDEKLTQLAKADINRKALLGVGAEEDEDEDGLSGMVGGMRSALGIGRGSSAGRSSSGRSSGRGTSKRASSGGRSSGGASKRTGSSSRRSSTKRARR